MLNAIKKSSFYETLVHSKNYFVTTLANEGLKFLSIPILTYLLSTSDYGVLNIFASWVSIFAVIAVANLSGAISRYYYEFSRDFGYFLGFSIVITAAAFSFSVVLILLFRKTLMQWMELPNMVVFFFIPAVLFEIINLIFRQVYQPLKQSKRIRKYSIGTVYITFALTIAFILLREDTKYIGRLQALVVVSGFYSVIKLRDVLKYAKIGFRKRYLKYIVNFSVPNIPYLLSGVILSQFDRIIINNQMGSSEAGLYSFAYNIGMLQLMVSNAIHNAWTPKYFANMHKNENSEIIKDASYFSRLMALAACFLILYGVEIGSVLSSSSYHASLYLIPLIVIGHFFVGISPFNKNAILHAKKTYITAAMTLSAGLINIVLNVWLIPIYGVVAAAYSTVFCYLTLFVTEYLVSKYYLKKVVVPLYTFKRAIIVLVLGASVYYAFFNTPEFNLIFITIKLAVLGILSVLLFYKELNSHLILKKL